MNRENKNTFCEILYWQCPVEKLSKKDTFYENVFPNSSKETVAALNFWQNANCGEKKKQEFPDR